MKVEFIQKAAALFYVHPRDLVGKARFKWLIPARFAAYKALRMRGWSYPRIAKLVGDRDHSSVMHGCDRAEYMMERDPEYAAKINELATFKLEALVLPEKEEPREDGEDWLKELLNE